VTCDRLEVVLPSAAGEDAPVDMRVERLHPAVEHLRETSDSRNTDDGEAATLERQRRAARRYELETATSQSLGELDDPRLVRNAQ
jgi:hypothetical protein